MGRTYDSLDAKAANKNGIFQIISGCLCFVLNVAIFIFVAIRDEYLYGYPVSGSGIWGGIFYIVSGALIHVSSKQRTSCLIITALSFNVISLILNIAHVICMGISVMGEERHQFYGHREDEMSKIMYPVCVTFFSLSTIFAFVETVLVIWAVVILSEAIYWQRLNDINQTPSNISTAAVDSKKEADKSEDTKAHFNHGLATVSIRVNAVCQILMTLISFSANVAAISIFVWCLNYGQERMNQTNGTAIITAPFFILLGYFGWTSAKTGNNKRIVTYLSLSVFGCLLSFLEGGGACYAIGNRRSMLVASDGADRFVSILVSLNVVIIVVAIVHLAMSIWGVVIASVALHKDETCFRCFSNCGCGQGCGHIGECSDRCCIPGSAAAGTHYQPIQFVVSHQGMTTLPDGQKALVVLLPMSANMNVVMDKPTEGTAAVSVVGGPAKATNDVFA